MNERPEFAMELAVKGMLPKNSVGSRRRYPPEVFTRAPSINNAAQKPGSLDFD